MSREEPVSTQVGVHRMRPLHLSVREMALRMGLTEANVKVVQFRALKRAADLEHLAPRPGAGVLTGFPA